MTSEILTGSDLLSGFGIVKPLSFKCSMCTEGWSSAMATQMVRGDTDILVVSKALSPNQ